MSKIFVPMKNLIFVVLVCFSMLFTSCRWFDSPANAKRIGAGYVKYDKGIYVVEIDSIRYVPDYVYTNESTRDGKTTMQPVDGMLLTCFTMKNSNKVCFIAGDRSEEYLEEYFTTNSTMLVFFIFLIFGCVIYAFVSSLHSEREKGSAT